MILIRSVSSEQQGTKHQNWYSAEPTKQVRDSDEHFPK